ncbi:hypothetical protein GCM10023235_06860 [Kitasatospora terrestris]|uniref:Uncharacterized protein n=1 Tax=Kitasatospora terrestris TaxID=258051 RepID=A0ABP9DDH6_9ACTN
MSRRLPAIPGYTLPGVLTPPLIRGTPSGRRRVPGGDAHKDIHVAAVITGRASRAARRSVPPQTGAPVPPSRHDRCHWQADFELTRRRRATSAGLTSCSDNSAARARTRTRTRTDSRRSRFRTIRDFARIHPDGLKSATKTNRVARDVDSRRARPRGLVFT